MKSKLGEWEAVYIHNRGNEYYTPGSPEDQDQNLSCVLYEVLTPLPVQNIKIAFHFL